MKSFVTVALGTSLALWAHTSTASTQTFIQVGGTAAGAQTNVGLVSDGFGEVNSSFGLETITASGSASAPGDLGSGSSFADSSLDPVTGALALRYGAAGGGVLQFGGFGSVVGEMLVSQGFRLSGTGRFTALMSVDVDWAVSGSNAGFNFAAQTLVRDGNNNAGTLQIGRSDAPDAGSISNRILSSSIENFGSERDITVLWRMSGAVSAGGEGSFASSLLDASNTGLIFFTTDGTLTATPTTAGFLSNPAFLDDPEPAAVPLPASVGLLSLALASLWIGRRRPRLV